MRHTLPPASLATIVIALGVALTTVRYVRRRTVASPITPGAAGGAPSAAA